MRPALGCVAGLNRAGGQAAPAQTLGRVTLTRQAKCLWYISKGPLLSPLTAASRMRVQSTAGSSPTGKDTRSASVSVAAGKSELRPDSAESLTPRRVALTPD